MKCMVIAMLALVGIARAVPFGLEGGIGLGEEGLGGLGEGLGGYHSGGGGYGHSGYGGGRHGYGSSGYGQGILRTGHNLGHHENDFSQEVHHHSASDHNIGGVLQAGGRGHNRRGYGSYGRGERGYGHHYNRGGYGI